MARNQLVLDMSNKKVEDYLFNCISKILDENNISWCAFSLGAEIEIDGIMPDEKVSVRIPEGCQNDQVIRVKGKGMPRFRSDMRGDLYVHASVIIPKKLTKSQRELLEKLASDLGEDYANARSPLEKLRDAFN